MHLYRVSIGLEINKIPKWPLLSFFLHYLIWCFFVEQLNGQRKISLPELQNLVTTCCIYKPFWALCFITIGNIDSINKSDSSKFHFYSMWSSYVREFESHLAGLFNFILRLHCSFKPWSLSSYLTHFYEWIHNISHGIKPRKLLWHLKGSL